MNKNNEELTAEIERLRKALTTARDDICANHCINKNAMTYPHCVPCIEATEALEASHD